MTRDIHADRLLIVTSLLLVAAGVVMVYSTSFVVAMQKFGDQYYFVKKQLIFVVMSIVLLLTFSRIHYDIYRRAAYPILILAIIGLLMIFIGGFGHEVGGAKRWVKIMGFGFQPSETAKLAVIIFLAYSLSSRKENIKSFSLGFLPNVLIPGVVIALIMSEPDLGTAVTLSIIVLMMNFVAGVRFVYIAGTVLAMVPVIYIVITSFSYMMRRIMIFLDPWKDPTGDGFQTVQSFIAFGSGGVWGVGLGEGKQKLFYLPEAHTDFIFSVIGEELGLIGVAVIILLYVFFLIGGIKVARKAKDLFGSLLALGLTFMVALQAAVNMAVVLGILPPKGLPLPFVSYGGTSLIVCMVSVGIMLNIYIKSNEH
jgi:cell division protein FtsW